MIRRRIAATNERRAGLCPADTDHEGDTMLRDHNHAHTRLMTACRAAALLAVGLAVALPSAVPLWADSHEDEKPVTTYTRVALWDVDRDHWSDFVDLFATHDKPILEKLFADGMITEWGIDANGLHTPDGYTHSTWYSASSMSALAKAGEAYMAAWDEIDDPDADAAFNAMIGRHRDYILETEGMRSAAATLEGGYFQGHMVKVTRDKWKDFSSYWKHRMKPVYERLLSDGAIVAYGLSGEAIVTEHPMMVEWWYIMADADGFDTVEAAFDASWEEMDEEGRRARWLSIMDTVDADSYRSWVTGIIHFQTAAH
jgi:hypothetical protein